MKVIVITQQGGLARLTDEQADAIRVQFRDQVRREPLPVVILPPGLGFAVIEADRLDTPPVVIGSTQLESPTAATAPMTPRKPARGA